MHHSASHASPPVSTRPQLPALRGTCGRCVLSDSDRPRGSVNRDVLEAIDVRETEQEECNCGPPAVLAVHAQRVLIEGHINDPLICRDCQNTHPKSPTTLAELYSRDFFANADCR